MISFFSGFLAILILIPFFSYLLVFVIVKSITRNHKRAVRIAIDTTTFFLFISIQFMIAEIWGAAYIWFFYIGILILAIIFSIIHWKGNVEIHYRKLLKGLWRIQFIVFFVIYFIFMLYGITTSILQTVT
ncbi:uncharacterized protein DUF3397 [Bacillus oleivorans]|uniref:Uncharacterized protein DUF3397 n=1 Tax=Bacillus oleivorans TaxID=1448271 RepID=A0A285D2J9_9BACI|nr:DUF3397 domain-containing protein [Bacillus oleivorans]SNX73413.1 uncharacterized protein DUF3397 [Bacillus oleivorans]